MAVVLAAKGSQDQWFTSDGSEQGLSFFNQVWKKHTSFSQSVEQHHIDGPTRNGGLSSIKLQKNGDLLGYTYFSISNGAQAQDHANWEQLIESVEWVIGGVVVDTQDSVFSENVAIDMFANNVSKSSNGPHPGSSATSYFYPLRFSFCEAPSSAIPWSRSSIRRSNCASAGVSRPRPTSGKRTRVTTFWTRPSAEPSVRVRNIR